MLYERYETKIIRRRKLLKVLFRFRLLIIGSAATLTTTGGTLVATKGAVNDKETLNSVYIYGEPLKYESSAFMSKVNYEFASQGSDDWNNEIPQNVGKYKMRSKGKNSFSSYYYGKDQEFEIVPKEIEVSIKQDSLTYGEIPTIEISDQLAYGDHLEEGYLVSYSDRTKANWTITPELSSIKISSEKGDDVTSCYDIKIVDKDVPILKRHLKINPIVENKVYSASPYSYDDFSIVEGSLVPGDSVTISSKEGNPNVGVYKDEYNIKIVDSNNLDMTSHYDIDIALGSLEIVPKKITFKSDDYEYVYDGTNHKFDIEEIIYDESELIKGHVAVFDYVDDDKVIKPGEYSNNFKVKIYDGKVDMSSNYDIELISGKTNILKRDLTVTANSKTSFYNGNELSDYGYTITSGTLADTDKIIITNGPSIVDVGSIDNELEISIKNKNTNADVMDCYNLNAEKGVLTVEPQPLQITLSPVEVYYDGYEHTNEYSITSGELAGNDYLVLKANESHVDAGVYDNYSLKVDVYKNSSVNNSNYSISYVGRKSAITINERPITIKTFSKSKTYDTTSIISTLSENEEKYEISAGTLADNEYLIFDYDNEKCDRTDAGENEIVSVVKIFHKVGETEDLEKDKDVTHNYNISFDSGTFTVNQRELYVSTKDYSHTYDRVVGIPEDVEIIEISSTEGDGLFTGHTLYNDTLKCDAIDVGEYEYEIDPEAFYILDENGEDVTHNYHIIFANDGKYSITKKLVNVTMTENFKMYDATPFISTVHIIDENNAFLDDDYLEFDEEMMPSVTYVVPEDARTTNNPPEGSYVVKMSDGTIVSDNYDINFVNNEKIFIVERPIIIESSSIEKTFDGKIDEYEVFVKEEESDLNYGLATGDQLVTPELNLGEEFAHATSNPLTNTFDVKIVNGDGKDVTNCYSIVKEEGTTTINPCELTIDFFENEIVYDGELHTFTFNSEDITNETEDQEIYISSGSLPEDYTMSGHAQITDKLHAGIYTDYEDVEYEFIRKNENVVEAQDGDFNVSIGSSKQEITKRPLSIKVNDQEKVYNGVSILTDLPSESVPYEIVNDTSLGTNDYIVFTYNNDLTEAGKVIIDATIKIYHQVGEFPDINEDLEITDLDYELDVTPGHFIVHQRPIYVSTVDIEHVYDRYEGIEEIDSLFVVSDSEGYPLVDGHTLANSTVTLSSKDPDSYDVYNAGDYSYVVNEDDFVILDSSDNNKTANYEIHLTNEAIYTILPRNIHVTMGGASKVYDGDPLTCSDYTVVEGVLNEGLLEEDYLQFNDLPSVTHVTDGHVLNAPSAEATQVFTTDGDDVTMNYIINFDSYGEIFITPRPIKFESTSESKTFDGTPIEFSVSVSEIGEDNMGLATEETEYWESEISQMNAHVCNAHAEFSVNIFDGDGNSINDDYAIEYNFGTYVITPCELVVSVHNYNIVYDGDVHMLHLSEDSVTENTYDFHISNGQMPDNYNLEISMDITMFNAGEYNDYKNKVTTFSRTNESVVVPNASDFVLTFVNDTQVISKRLIVIKTLGGTMVSDGETCFGQGFEEYLWWIASGSLAEDDIITTPVIQNSGLVQPGTYELVLHFDILDRFGESAIEKGNYLVIKQWGTVVIYEA